MEKAFQIIRALPVLTKNITKVTVDPTVEYFHLSQCIKWFPKLIKIQHNNLDLNRILKEYKWPELYPPGGQSPKLWRGMAPSWLCKQSLCSHLYTCLPQVLPSCGSTLWLNQGQGLRLQSKLRPLSNRISAQREVRRQGCLSFWRKYHFHFITF